VHGNYILLLTTPYGIAIRDAYAARHVMIASHVKDVDRIDYVEC
jgi:hypothetical protein